jgi:hypothetical protein
MEKCAICGKEMGVSKNATVIGFHFKLSLSEDIDQETMSEVQKQFGPYEMKDYKSCVECYLRKMGFTEK